MTQVCQDHPAADNNGLTPDESPLVMRDESVTEIYELDWQGPSKKGADPDISILIAATSKHAMLKLVTVLADYRRSATEFSAT